MGEVDYSKLDPALQEKIKKWQQESVPNKQLQTLEDLADMSQELINILGEQKKSGEKNVKELGATLLDIRDKLGSLDSKEAPEMPDYAKPIIKAIGDMQKALEASIKAIEVKPDVKVSVPDIAAPEVPEVDLSELEKIVKVEIPKAFEKAVKAIPTTPAVKLDPLENVIRETHQEMMNMLESIDTASRMKPQFPVSQGSTSGIVEGNVAPGATDSGNPVKVGGKYNLTQPTYADGQRGDAQIDSRGNLKATLMPFNSNTAMKNTTDNADGVAVSATSNWLGALNRNTVFNGVSWDRLRGDSTNGMYVNIRSKQEFATKIDTTTTADVIYVGKAAIGSSGASAVWQVKKLDKSTLALDKTWADGNDSFDNIWNNRASLSYS